MHPTMKKKTIKDIIQCLPIKHSTSQSCTTTMYMTKQAITLATRHKGIKTMNLSILNTAPMLDPPLCGECRTVGGLGGGVGTGLLLGGGTGLGGLTVRFRGGGEIAGRFISGLGSTRRFPHTVHMTGLSSLKYPCPHLGHFASNCRFSNPLAPQAGQLTGNVFPSPGVPQILHRYLMELDCRLRIRHSLLNHHGSHSLRHPDQLPAWSLTPKALPLRLQALLLCLA